MFAQRRANRAVIYRSKQSPTAISISIGSGEKMRTNAFPFTSAAKLDTQNGIRNSQTVSINVTGAVPAGGLWRASALSGTVTENADQIAGARLAVVAGAGHISNLEAPNQVNRLLLDFLGTTRSSRGR